MTDHNLPADLYLDGFTSQVCDAPTAPAPVRDLFGVAFDIQREAREALLERDRHDDEARKAAEAEARAMADEFVAGRFDTAELSEKVAEHRGAQDRAQRRLSGLEAAKPKVVAAIREKVAEHAAEWRRDAASAGDAALVDLTTALAMTREAYTALRHSLGSLSALDDFEGRQEGPWGRETREGNLRVMPRPDGWVFALEPAIADLERAVDLATRELRDRTATDAERRRAEATAGKGKKTPKPEKAAVEAPVAAPAVSDEVPTFTIGGDDDE